MDVGEIILFCLLNFSQLTVAKSKTINKQRITPTLVGETGFYRKKFYCYLRLLLRKQLQGQATKNNT